MMIDFNDSWDANNDNKTPNRLSQLLIFRSGYPRFSYALNCRLPLDPWDPPFLNSWEGFDLDTGIGSICFASWESALLHLKTRFQLSSTSSKHKKRLQFIRTTTKHDLHSASGPKGWYDKNGDKKTTEKGKSV